MSSAHSLALGRLDLLTMKLLDTAADRLGQTNPVVQAMYPTYRGLIADTVNTYLGPDTLYRSNQKSDNRPARMIRKRTAKRGKR